MSNTITTINTKTKPFSLANGRLQEENGKASSVRISKLEKHKEDASIKLYPGDCRNILAEIERCSVHLVVTDPPYFLDGLDEKWRKGNYDVRRATGTVGGLPVGMKFDPAQGAKLQRFMEPVVAELLRVLKPGGFMLMFAAPRLYHRVAMAAEDAGFEIRDTFAWRFTKRAQCKAFAMDHIIRQRGDMTEADKSKTIRALNGRKTPQLRPQFEAVLCAQKPREGTFVDNWLAHETGLIDVNQTLTGRVPETVMTVEKENRDPFNCHSTPKPMALCEHLIRVFSTEGQTVLDPFVGSGTTCIAARQAGRHSIGIDVNPKYIENAYDRIDNHGNPSS